MAYRYRRHLTRRRLRRLLGRRWRRRRQSRALAASVAAGLTLAILTHGHHQTTTAPAPAPVPAQDQAPPASGGGNVALGQQLATGYGWGAGAQWGCLYALWQRESGWSNTADNPVSGAYGIAQALGHGPTNQYPAGPANPPVSSASAQITWGLGYIAGRYESPCAAWAHEQADSWY